MSGKQVFGKLIDWISIGVLFFVPLHLFGTEGCTPVGKQIAKTAIDVALAMCIAENPGADEKELQALCHYADELAPTVRDILASQRKGMLKGHCSPTTVTVTDGGK